MPFVKDFHLSKVFAVRLRRPTENERTQHNSTITHHDGDYSIPADIRVPMHPGSLARDPGLQVSINVPSATSSRGDSSARIASDAAQTYLPLVQGVAAAIPFAGPPLQAAISGLLSILQAIDRRTQNKADLDRLASRLHRLSSHMCNAPTAQDPYEQYRRDSIIGILQDTSAQLTRLQKRRLEYASVTQAIAGCSIEIDRYLLESLWSFQMQQSQTARGQAVTQLTAAVTLGCATLVDATGHEHSISVTLCASFQQLNHMLQVLFESESIEAQIQRRYMEQGQYDLCIDDDKQVTRLTSHEWPRIEAGTTIVMRVVFEEKTYSTVRYTCHFCGAVNHISAKYPLLRQASCSINCQKCKRRFQISPGGYTAKRSTQSSNIDSVPRTEAELHLIRNFHIQLTTPTLRERQRLHQELAYRRGHPVNEEARDLNVGGASGMAYSHGSEFFGDGSTISPQPSRVSPSHDAEYGHDRFEEIEEDGNDDYDENGTEDSDDGNDHEEWEDCEDGEDCEETKYHGEL